MSWPFLIAVVVLSISLFLYLLQVMMFVGAMQRARKAPEPPAPIHPHKISVLKPLSGLDDGLRENLESFAVQHGCTYEVLFGVSKIDDPAAMVAADFIEAHPEVEARIVLTDPNAGMNPKVAQLIGLEAMATGEIIVISDSNVLVHPDYLRKLVGELYVPGVHLASNVIAGTGEQTMGSTFENLLLATFQAPGVVVGYELSNGGKLAVTVGKSMATWRTTLHEAGGFERVKNVLAEDQALARIYQAQGHRVAMCLDPIENRNMRGTFLQTVHRHARWAKTRRSIMPNEYLIEPIIVPLIFATLMLAVWPGWMSLTLYAGVALVQMIGAQAFMHYLRGTHLPVYMWPIEIGRTYTYVACWLSAWTGRYVRWRGNRLELGEGAHLVATTAEARAAVKRAEANKVGHRDITEDLLARSDRMQGQRVIT